MTLVQTLKEQKHQEMTHLIETLDWEDFKQDDVRQWKEETRNHFLPQGHRSINYHYLLSRIRPLNKLIGRTDSDIEEQLFGLYLLDFYGYYHTLEGVFGLLAQYYEEFVDQCQERLQEAYPYVPFTVNLSDHGLQITVTLSKDQKDILDTAYQSANLDLLLTKSSDNVFKNQAFMLMSLIQTKEIPVSVFGTLPYKVLRLWEIFPNSQPQANTNILTSDQNISIIPTLLEMVDNTFPITLEVTQ